MVMGENNFNKLTISHIDEDISKVKIEAAKDVSAKEKDNGDITSREAGNIVKTMIEALERNMINRD
ncbi:Small, acid-soluble spore protein, alpha/beta type [Clostridium liquoris]|jgi:hypothetical protein|uniref:Small, acid-soluble spore protein, alpha/beta type n=1 Tax=Clostridium liquoris TaxID=1289519 RepID=A0A2T0B478_9CLOT|nr:small, acid-soluble spore protein, alpha/beta type [Clostridium liquoris]PRR78633.1 Small, acid-soluble spore protein, alpha/beta type [Clostridium liquoris]